MRRTPLLLIIVLLLVMTWVIGLGCWPFITWSRLNCSCEYIDINSGRIRYQRYLVGLCIRESVEETALSRLVSADTEGKPAEWRCVNTFSPMVRHSPHYRYHGAIYQVQMLELFWDNYRFTPQARLQMARDVLSLWNSGEGDMPANRYIGKLESTLSGREGDLIDMDDLPK